MLKAQIGDNTPAYGNYAIKTTVLFMASIFLIYITAWVLQNSMLFSWDNSIILHETQKLLSGGTYLNNFFETSPPMILYLCIPPVLFSKFLSLPMLFTFRAYIFLWVFLSLWLCRSLGKQIFLKQDVIISNIFFLLLLSVFLILPLFEMGQREHIFLIFSIPYILAVAIRLENKTLNIYKAVLIGLLAGLGFAIKPFFVLTPVFLELYVALSRRSLLACLRPETMAIFVVLSVYTAIALILHPDYFHIIIPYAMRLYYSGIGLPWGKIIFHPASFFCYFSVLFYFIQYNVFSSYKIFTSVLCVALISFLFIFILQRLDFYYHILPALALAILMDGFLFSLIFLQPPNRKQFCWLFVLLIANLVFLFYAEKVLMTILILYPRFFFGFFACIFAIVLYRIQENKNLIKLLLSIAVITALAYWFSHVILCEAPYGSMLANHCFILTVLLLFVLFNFLIPNTRYNKASVFTITALALSIFAFPAYITYMNYLKAMVFKQNTSALISYMKKNMQHRSIYLFATHSRLVFPLLDYANVVSVSRFPFFWMVPGLAKKMNLTQTGVSFQQYAQDKNFLINMITEDLNQKKPEFVLIDIAKRKERMSQQFEFLNYFLDNKDFQQAWKSYHYLTTINGDTNLANPYAFHVAIYERNFSPNNL